MSPGWRCGSGSAGRGPQVLVQHRDPLWEQRVHIKRELHGPLCRANPARVASLPSCPDAPPPGVYFLCWENPQSPPRSPPLLTSPGPPRPRPQGTAGWGAPRSTASGTGAHKRGRGRRAPAPIRGGFWSRVPGWAGSRLTGPLPQQHPFAETHPQTEELYCGKAKLAAT